METKTSQTAEQSHRTKGLLRLTMACNERCPFCNVPVEDYPEPTATPEQVAQELEEFAASGEQTLVISGGEPTLLRRRLVQLVSDARAKNIPLVELQTNAVLIDPSYAQSLAQAGLTSAFVSLLSHVPEHHDTLTGLPGAFGRCIAGIDALLNAGIRVTLNPVTARLTQTLISDYVDFVADRLPRVRSISLSAVQPHGRAAKDPDLVPDYGVLSHHVRAARARAEHHKIELINPYCGLPLCVGWEDGLRTSVEAIEAASGGWQTKPGIDNQGNKRHGDPCRSCALRTRCGGAWHAVWDTHAGTGISAPVSSQLPWFGTGPAAAQSVVHAPGGLTDAHYRALHAASGPTVWAWTDGLTARDPGLLIRSGCTDLGLDIDLSDAGAVRPTLRLLRRLIKTAALSSPQRQLRVHLHWIDAEAPSAGVALAHALGAWSLTLRGQENPGLQTPGMDLYTEP
jgi:MoaA/NifB/PqqE/SkfB family radical SAM enzyme